MQHDAGRTQWLIIGNGAAGSTRALAGVLDGIEHLETRADRTSGADPNVIGLRGHRLGGDDPYVGLEPCLPFELSLALAEEPNRRTVLEARHHLISEAAGGALVVEDAQWLDTATLRLLATVAEDATTHGFAMIVSHRPRSDHLHLGALDAALTRSHPALALGPYDEETATHLLTEAGIDPASAEHLQGIAGQTPWFLDLISTAWRGDQPGLGTWLEGGPPPTGVIEAIRSRLSVVSAGGRELLTALCFGATPDDSIIDQLPAMSSLGDVGAALAELEDEGLLLSNGLDVVPLVAETVLALQPVTERTRYHLAAAAAQEPRADTAITRAEHLLAAGERSPEATRSFLEASDLLRDTAPDLAAGWLDRAQQALAPAEEIAGRRVVIEVRRGRPLEALQAGGHLLDQDPATELGRVALAAGARAYVEARRTALACGPLEVLAEGTDAERAEVARRACLACRAASGDLDSDAIAEVLRTASPTYPLLEVTRLMLTGIVEMADGRESESLAACADAATLELSVLRRLDLPFSSTALATWLGVYAADLPYARRIAERAVATPAPDGGVRRSRLARLLFVSVLNGATELDSDLIDRWASMGPLDQLVTVAAWAGAARRRNDLGALSELRGKLHDVLLQPPSLLDLPAFCEAIVCAARLGDWEIVDAATAARDQAAASLPIPQVAVLCAWTDLQTMAARDKAHRPDSLRHFMEQRLPEVGERSAELSSALLCWADLLDGTAKADEVRAAGQQLQQLGYRWEATRMVGSAAMHLADETEVKDLLATARELRATMKDGQANATSLASLLSERELEVARLVSDGHTYKEVGARLFISPKTVEHHVARIRQRLGVTSRSELLSVLRAQLPEVEPVA